jgi:hypothetical protein
MLQRTLSYSNTGPRTSQPAWRCTPKGGARGWSRSSWPRASASSWPAPGRGIGSWSGRSSAAAWRRATARSAASSAAAVAGEPGGCEGGAPVRPSLRLAWSPAGPGGHEPSAIPTLAHHEGRGRGSAYSLRCRLGPCTQPARPIRAEGRRTAPTASVKRRRNSSTDSLRHGAACGGNSMHSANNLLPNSASVLDLGGAVQWCFAPFPLAREPSGAHPLGP